MEHSLWGAGIIKVTSLMTDWTFFKVVKRSGEGNTRIDTHLEYNGLTPLSSAILDLT